MQGKSRMAKATRILGLYGRAMRLIWEANPGLMASTLVLLFLGAITSPVQVWISKLMIDRISALVGQRDGNGMQVLLAPLALYIGVWAISQVSQSVLMSFRE